MTTTTTALSVAAQVHHVSVQIRAATEVIAIDGVAFVLAVFGLIFALRAGRK